ncbi:hypothetical protein MMC30_002933 [Trapelia coarctata]|nr:hypothetical protein [Trapelia coarctata]
MRSVLLSLSIAAVLAAVKAVVLPRVNSAAFSNPKFISSAGGNAYCVTGIINVTVSATNEKILYSGPADNMAATELLVEFSQQNSTVGTRINGGPTVVTGTYGIFSKLCVPAKASAAANVQTVQFLTHGGTLDNTYWDLAPGYSYIDAAAVAGYATFSYDRLGTGMSDHPDPIQVVQVGVQVEVAHVLVQGLRAAHFGGWSFQKVVGVGHSLGTGLTQGVTTKYPKDFDAVILTGTSAYFGSVSIGVASTAQQIANTDPSGRFAGLANGYFTPAPVPQAIQFAFYRYPHFVQSIFNSNLKTYQTNALGETFTLASAYVPSAAFTGPVDVVDGQNDFFYCGGDCTFPTNQAAVVQPVFYPAASAGSQSYLVPDAGHNINAHFAAPQAFAQMLAFLKTNAIT